MHQKGSAASLLLVIATLLIIGGCAYWYIQIRTPISTPQINTTSNTQSATPQTYTPLFAQDDGPGSPDCYYVSNNQVYVLPPNTTKNYTLVNGADVVSFKDQSIFGLCFGTDKNHTYRDDQILEGYNPSSFKILWYAKVGTIGARSLFIQRDASSVGVFSFSDDSDSAFVSESTIPNSDPQSFKELDGAFDFAPWAKDKDNVYCQGGVVSGADPSSVIYSNQGVRISVLINGVRKTINQACNISS